MDEIRFNQPPREESKKKEDNKESSKKKISSKIFKKIVNTFGIVIVLVVIAMVVFLGKDFFKNGFSNNIDSEAYSAVFLTNGQVYFGNLISKDDSEFVLTNVYYLQLSGDEVLSETRLNETKFSLIKLGNELHGPTDELFIISSQVLFYEKLRDDSRVVEAIKNYNN